MSTPANFKTTDYKAMYEWYKPTEWKMLRGNKSFDNGSGYPPDTLFCKWDMLRVKYDNEVRSNE